MKYFAFIIILLSGSLILEAQVRIRLFSGLGTEAALFTVTKGSFSVSGNEKLNIILQQGSSLLVSDYDEKVYVSLRNRDGFICDTLKITGLTGMDSFSLRSTAPSAAARTYSGNLHCYYDLKKVLFINVCEIEEYIAGVVMTEGGEGRNIEYCKSQALLARTFMYRNMERHQTDNFNLCDDVHCQAFNGINTDPVITSAVHETSGQVITDMDSILILPAFHSNCGGETAKPEDVWLSGQPYLKKVTDPYCTKSRNAIWKRSIRLSEWISYLQNSGYKGIINLPAMFAFSQTSRLSEYKAGSFVMPLRQIRSDHNLRSTYFSVAVEGDSVVFTGRGYGHGVGLCQEGAMVMAEKGFSYKQIIDFYFSGVIISDIKNARKPEKVL